MTTDRLVRTLTEAKGAELRAKDVWADGGFVEDIHTCPECGRAETRRTE